MTKTRGKLASIAASAAVALSAATTPADLAGAAGEARPAVFLEYQQDWILDDAKIATVQKSRRVGMDWAEAFRAVRDRMSGDRTNDYWYSSADESAAREFMVYVQMWAKDLYGAVFEVIEEEQLHDSDSFKVFVVTLPEVDGRRPRITAMTSNPRAFRSKGGDVTLSELAFHNDPIGMWKAAFPCTTWGGRLRVISTHNGEDSILNKLVQMSLRHSDPDDHGQPKTNDVASSLHTVTIDDAIEQGLVERINQVTGEEHTRESFRAHLRQGCLTEENWQEEFLCVPAKSKGSYFPYELLSPCSSADDAVETDNLALLIEEIENLAGEATALWVGVDVGRRHDRFVIWVLGEFGGVWRTVGLLVWDKRPFSEMESAINTVMSIRLPSGVAVTRACIDSTGIGMHLAENATTKWPGRCEAVNFTLAVKTELFTRLHAALEDREVTIPDDDIVHLDLHSVRKTVTAAGNVRFDASQGEHGHADRATGLALAVHAAAAPRSQMRTARTPRGTW